MAKKIAKKKGLPKGIRRRVLGDGETERFDALVKIDGRQKTLGSSATVAEAVALRNAYFKKKAEEGKELKHEPAFLTVRQLGELCLTNEWDIDRFRARVLEMAEFAEWPANQVGDEHIQIWIDKMARTPIKSGRSAGQLPTRGTLDSALSLLRRVYKWAKMPARKYVSHNPCEGVTIGNSTDIRPKSKRNVLDYLREDEAQKLLDADRDTLPLEPRTKFLVLMFSGARPSDVWRLRWERIDWKAESIRFTSAKTSKQEERDYTVHALPQLTAALREWHMACGRPDTGLVFPAKRDADSEDAIFDRGYDAGWQDKKERKLSVWYVDPTENRALSALPGPIPERERSLTRDEARKLRRLRGERREVKDTELTIYPGYRSKIGIKRNVPLYALRHTCASHLLLGSQLFAGGRAWSREEVQAQLGHLDSAATEFYMRSLGILGRRAAQESKAALRKAREP